MSTFPPSPRAAFLAWCQSHALVFEAQSTAIGVSVAQATAFKNQASAAAAALAAAEAARSASKGATTTMLQEFADLRELASGCVRSIRTFAEASLKPDIVYGLAEIDPIAPPSPTPAPGTPADLAVTLLPTGALSLKWKCVNPGTTGGVVYEVFRQIGPAGAMSYIGVTGKKTFEDGTLPAGLGGANQVQYQITGTRSTQRGVPGLFTVRFGVGSGGGGMQVMAVTPGEMKLAA